MEPSPALWYYNIDGLPIDYNPPDEETLGPESPPRRAIPWYIAHNARTAKLTIYQGEVSLVADRAPVKGKAPPRREEGDIVRFSRKSRLRLMRMLNRIRTGRYRRPLFLTLTARHGKQDPATFRDVFVRQFLKKFRRVAGPGAYMWRLEPHKDGYPHIHMMFFSTLPDAQYNPEAIIERVRLFWWDIIGDHSRAAKAHSCKVVSVQDKRGVIAYVAKYVAKVDGERDLAVTGRRWGRSSNFDTCPITVFHLTREDAIRVRYALHWYLKNCAKINPWSSEYVLYHDTWWLWMDYHLMIQAFTMAELFPLVEDIRTFDMEEGKYATF